MPQWQTLPYPNHYIHSTVSNPCLSPSLGKCQSAEAVKMTRQVSTASLASVSRRSDNHALSTSLWSSVLFFQSSFHLTLCDYVSSLSMALGHPKQLSGEPVSYHIMNIVYGYVIHIASAANWLFLTYLVITKCWQKTVLTTAIINSYLYCNKMFCCKNENPKIYKNT